MRSLMNLRDEILNYLKGLVSLDLAALTTLNAKGWRMVTTEHSLPDLSAAAAVAACLPAGCIPLGVSGRVDTAVVTSGAGNAFNVGITGGDADAFGADVAGAADTQWDSTDHTVSPISLWAASAQGVTIDGTGVETLSSGAVTLWVSYLTLDAPPVA